MAKRKEDLKKIVSIAISPKQHCDLKDLARYTGKSVSALVRELLPGKAEIEDAKAELDRVMESGNKKKLKKFVRQSFDDSDKAVAIIDVLIPDAIEGEEDEQ